MTEVVNKYVLTPLREQSIAMPLCARPLAVQVQGESSLCVWAQVIVGERAQREIDFLIVGTGHDFDSRGWAYLGSAQMGSLVWHVYFRAGKVQR